MIKHYLKIKKGFAERTSFPLRGRLTIGRSPQNDIHLWDPRVSRYHAAVYLNVQKVIAEDLSSRNGTFINGQRAKKATLTNGDTIMVGNIVLQLVQEEKPQRKADLANTMDLTPTDA